MFAQHIWCSLEVLFVPSKGLRKGLVKSPLRWSRWSSLSWSEQSAVQTLDSLNCIAWRIMTLKPSEWTMLVDNEPLIGNWNFRLYLNVDLNKLSSPYRGWASIQSVLALEIAWKVWEPLAHVHASFTSDSFVFFRWSSVLTYIFHWIISSGER